ncbi:MAG: hypothetical protein Fur005_49220 [Roseiflexaceae bacterium]
MPTKKNFTGQYLDDTGLLYYNARYYDPTTARFISADSIVPGAGALTLAPHDPVATAAWGKAKEGGPANPQNLNRYSYVRNNPLTRVDPTGHADGDPDQLGALRGSGGGGGKKGGGAGVGTAVTTAVNSACADGDCGNEVRTTADKAVSLFRAIDDAELPDLLRFGDYGFSPSGSGKYFALTKEGLDQFVQAAWNAGRKLTTTQMQVPQEVLKLGYRFFDPKGGGESIHFADDVLPVVYKVAGLPKILDAPWVRTIGK